MNRPRSDVEQLARTRILIASLLIYLVTMGFMALGDRLYEGSDHLFYSRLATIPFFLLLVIRWLRLVRVRPPQELLEARRLMGLNRPRAARERLTQILGSPSDRRTRRVDRARRLLHDGLAVPVQEEIQLEIGRCSFQLGELDQAVPQLSGAWSRLPARADVAIELAEALQRAQRESEAARVLREALPVMDAVDLQTLQQQPSLMRLLDDAPIPPHSRFRRRIRVERGIFALLMGATVAHAMHLYLGLF